MLTSLRSLPSFGCGFSLDDDDDEVYYDDHDDDDDDDDDNGKKKKKKTRKEKNQEEEEKGIGDNNVDVDRNEEYFHIYHQAIGPRAALQHARS